MPRKARITPTQLKALKDMGLSVQDITRKRRKPLGREITARMVSESLGTSCGALGAESDEAGFTGDWPGAATHHLAKACPCPVCGQNTHTMVQTLDGLKIGDPQCEACHEKQLPPRRRHGRAARERRMG